MDTRHPQMRAVRRGGARPEHVGVESVDRPEPGPSEVLVRVEAASINPFDLSVVLGHDSPVELPRTPGRDLAGVVESGPPELVGRPVWATGGELGTRRDGFQAEYAVLPVDGVRARPAGLNPDQAASVGVAFTTAWYALVEAGQLQLGDRVLVTGGAGAVGTAAIQLARWAGVVQVQALVLDAAEADVARDAGATMIAQDPARLAEGAAQGRPTLCLDTVGGPVLNAVVSAMEPGGRILNISTTGDGSVTIDLRAFYRAGLTLRGVATGAFDVVQDARILEVLGRGFEEGALRPPRIAVTLPLERASEAYGLVAGGRPPGKVVLKPTP
jgi:NADPH:quinone reductase